MRRTTGTIALIASTLAFAGAAQAGSMEGYNVSSTTTEQIGVVTIQPTATTDATYIQPVTTEPQVGEIIYNTEPYTPSDAGTQTGGYVTSSDGTIIYSDGTTTTQ